MEKKRGSKPTNPKPQCPDCRQCLGCPESRCALCRGAAASDAKAPEPDLNTPADIQENLLKDFHHIHEQKVQWGDMDAFGHVNNAMYFRYFESARVPYGLKIGIADYRNQSINIGPILAWTECRFIRPVVFPDTLLIGVRSVSIQGSEIVMEMLTVSSGQQRVVAEAKALIVLFDYINRRRVKLPPAMIKRIEALEGRTIPLKHKT